jgi:negative regulator of sigma E activity
MKPDTQSWNLLQEHAASRLRPGLAARVLRAARPASGEVLLGHFAFSAAAAAICLAVVVVVQTQRSQAESERNLADWQAIAREAQQLVHLP